MLCKFFLYWAAGLNWQGSELTSVWTWSIEALALAFDWLKVWWEIWVFLLKSSKTRVWRLNLQNFWQFVNLVEKFDNFCKIDSGYLNFFVWSSLNFKKSRFKNLKKLLEAQNFKLKMKSSLKNSVLTNLQWFSVKIWPFFV